MSTDFGSVTIPAHYKQIPKLDFDALLPHLPRRTFHDEWNVPEAWPAETAALVNDVMYATAALIDRLPNLKVISFAGTGVWDRVDVAHATQRGSSPLAICTPIDPRTSIITTTTRRLSGRAEIVTRR